MGVHNGEEQISGPPCLPYSYTSIEKELGKLCEIWLYLLLTYLSAFTFFIYTASSLLLFETQNYKGIILVDSVG